MKKLLAIFAVAAFVFASCGNTNNEENTEIADSTEAVVEEVVDTLAADTLAADTTVAEVVAE